MYRQSGRFSGSVFRAFRSALKEPEWTFVFSIFSSLIPVRVILMVMSPVVMGVIMPLIGILILVFVILYFSCAVPA